MTGVLRFIEHSRCPTVRVSFQYFYGSGVGSVLRFFSKYLAIDIVSSVAAGVSWLRSVCACYRAMHNSAKRGLAIALSSVIVLVSVCDVAGWKSHTFFWKITTRTISPTPTPLVAQLSSLLSGEHGDIFGRLDWRWGGEDTVEVYSSPNR